MHGRRASAYRERFVAVVFPFEEAWKAQRHYEKKQPLRRALGDAM